MAKKKTEQQEPERPRLGMDKWLELKPRVHQAGTFAAKALQLWAEVCAEAVADRPHAHWRWVLADLREYCLTEGEECPYQVSYLVQLAETHTVVKGNFDRGVQPSVLIEGRNLPHLLDIIEEEPGCTVSRIKAHVYAHNHPGTQKGIDEIEREQSTKRRDAREKSKHAAYVQRILNWSADEADQLLPNLKAEASAYEEAILRLADQEGVAFKPDDVTRALRTVKELNKILKDMAPVKAKPQVQVAA